MKPREPGDPTRDRLLDRLHAAVDHGDAARGRRLLAKIEATGDDAEAAYARWRLSTLSDDLEAAVAGLTRDLERFPDVPELQHALGLTLLETGRPADALPYLEEACYLDSDFTDAWHDLGWARCETGDYAGARSAYEEVFDIDTDPSQPPPRFDVEQVEKWAERGRAALPGRLQHEVKDVPIIVEPYPERWILDAPTGEPPMDPRLLGLFSGPTWPELHGGDAVWGSPVVYVFQRNLERVCADSREMAEQVRITVQHELGHFLRLEEADLHDRGLG